MDTVLQRALAELKLQGAQSRKENCPEMPSELPFHSNSIETRGHYDSMVVKYMALFKSRNIFLYIVLCAFRAWSTDEIKVFDVKIKAIF